MTLYKIVSLFNHNQGKTSERAIQTSIEGRYLTQKTKKEENTGSSLTTALDGGEAHAVCDGNGLNLFM